MAKDIQRKSDVGQGRSKDLYLGQITAAQAVCAALNNMDLARPHMWQPLGKLLRPRQAQAGRHHHQQGPVRSCGHAERGVICEKRCLRWQGVDSESASQAATPLSCR